jgi:hypothetical protein
MNHCRVGVCRSPVLVARVEVALDDTDDGNSGILAIAERNCNRNVNVDRFPVLVSRLNVGLIDCVDGSRIKRSPKRLD